MTALTLLRALLFEGRPVTFDHDPQPEDLCNWKILYRREDGSRIRERCEGCNHLPASTTAEDVAKAHLKYRAGRLRAEALEAKAKHRKALEAADALGAAAAALEEQAAFFEDSLG